LHPRQEFRISRGRRAEVRNVFVRLEKDGVAGYGEASPNAFYRETWEGVTGLIEGARPRIEALTLSSTADIATAWSELWPELAPSRAAQCAVDLALWDWLGRKNGVSVCEVAWGRPPASVPTFCTIGLSTAEELREKIEELQSFPQIKIKSNAAADFGPIRQVRAVSSALLAVDANAAWSAESLGRLSQELAECGVAFIEQPLPPAEDHLLREARSCLPLIADESCVTEADVERVAGCFAGFNIKLVKCGGLTPALRMIRRGRELGCKIMVGCMLESSALIAAGAVVAQGTDYADLDGAWLIADDPVRGWRFSEGVLIPPETAGLGVEPLPGLFED
jgi:L-alanine-DL-glutamate epimerase-like enolase superfamily enzyme